MNRRVGKIARLPRDTREQVNTLLRDGVPYGEIIDRLKLPVNEQNMVNWKEGGYQDWLAEQARLEDMAAKREFALEIVRQNEGSKLQEATLHLAASQLYEALTDFDLVNLKNLLRDKPENYAQIVNSLAKLSKGALDIEKYKEAVRVQKEKIQAELNVARAQGLRPETLEKIEQALNLL